MRFSFVCSICSSILQDEYGCIDTCSAKHLRMVWTFIAAWFCYNSPFFPSEESIRRANSPDEVANLDVSRSVLQRVAQGFADFIVENSRREDRTVGCNGESGWHLWVAGIFKGILGHQLGFARLLQNICHRSHIPKGASWAAYPCHPSDSWWNGCRIP